MERPLTLSKEELGNKMLIAMQGGYYDLDNRQVPQPFIKIKVCKIEYSPLAFGIFPINMYPTWSVMTPKQQIESIKQSIMGMCATDDLVLEENPMLQGNALFKVYFTDGTSYLYHENGEVTCINEKEKANKEVK
mgnify:CR=1 FL=1